MKLSKNLSLKEVTRSTTAQRLGIDNTPTEEYIKNLKYIAENIFQPMRDHFAVPIFVSSGYRSPELNKAIGGSPRSFHCYGMALDLDQDYRNTTLGNGTIFHYIKDNLPFTELIYEFGDDNGPDWVHVALAKGRENEKVVKIAKRINGKNIYELWN
jgi:hypothetical protein